MILFNAYSVWLNDNPPWADASRLYGSSAYFFLPGDDTASIAKEPNSALSDTQREPPVLAGPLHHPAQVSLVPVAEKQI